MDLSLVKELGDILENYSGTQSNVIQFENIFKFILNLEINMGSNYVNNLKDKIQILITEQGTNVSLEHVNSIASSVFLQNTLIKNNFLDLFSNDLRELSFSPDEIEEIDIDQDSSHHEETFHITEMSSLNELPSDELYGSDKCPCICHTEHHSVKHCFTCAVKFIQGGMYFTTKKDKGLLQPAKFVTESINS